VVGEPQPQLNAATRRRSKVYNNGQNGSACNNAQVRDLNQQFLSWVGGNGPAGRFFVLGFSLFENLF